MGEAKTFEVGDSAHEPRLRVVGGMIFNHPVEYVYIAGYEPAPGVMFLKVGVTGSPQQRQRAYSGMLPGGLSFMFRAKVPSRGEALWAERHLLTLLSGLDGFTGVGGEWFQCAPMLKLSAIDLLGAVGKEVLQERVSSVPAFGERKAGKRGKRKVA